MKSTFFAVVVATLALQGCFAKQPTPKLKFVGAADGRSFFAEPIQEVARNWDQAKAYCETAGMHLAEISTAGQVAMLKAVTDPTIRTGSDFWTSARDSLTASRFIWEATGQVPSDTIIDWDTTALAVNRGCAMLVLPVNPATDPSMKGTACTSNAGVLCQLSTS